MSAQKSIFITGAASGIGRATALFFASRGWFVGLFDLDEAALASLAEEVGTDNCCYQAMDVTRPEDVAAAVNTLSGRTGGKLDVLFNCAGILFMGPHQRISLEHQKKIVEVNFNGILNCIHACFDLLKKTPAAHIINMSSASAAYGTPELAVYSATKHAVGGLTEALNIEFEPHGIQVCDVMAPYVRTPMIVDAKVQASSVERLGIRLKPVHVARVVWKAAHGNRVHWKVSLLLKIMMLLNWAFPFTRRSMVRLLTVSPE